MASEAVTPEWTVEQRIEDYARRVDDIADDYNFETDVLEALLGRSQLAGMWASLTPAQQQEVARVDGALVNLHNRVAEVVEAGTGHPRAHWWWYLAEGPQVRAEYDHTLRRAS